ncbi:MAG: Glycine oxidase [Planctomycetota bacterium]
MSIDCCIIGGGVIGLSIARELAGRGRRVTVVSREPRRSTASWAASGIFPPAPEPPAAVDEPNAALTALSDRLHWQWAGELKAETGIDTGLVRCGGIYLPVAGQPPAALAAEAEAWRARGVAVEWLDGPALAAAEPALARSVAAGRLGDGLLLPGEARIRPSRHLAALEQSCRSRGVAVQAATAVTGLDLVGDRLAAVRLETPAGAETLRPASMVLAAGAWSGGLAAEMGLRLDTRPIRGQIALLRFPRQWLDHVVNRGLDYLVPREDGHLLVGSTLEDVGFEPVTTDAAIAGLRALAADLLGDLGAADMVQTWAGLRPGSPDGLPTLGPVPGVANAFVATGHYRSGIHQSTGTAVILADLVEGREPPLPLAAFAPERHARSGRER